MKIDTTKPPTKAEIRKLASMSNYQVVCLWERTERFALGGGTVDDEVWDALREELCVRNINPDTVLVTFGGCYHVQEVMAVAFIALGGTWYQLALALAGEQDDPYILPDATCSTCQPQESGSWDEALVVALRD